MKKRIFAIMSVLALVLMMSVTALAADKQYLTDDAGLLTESEAASLEEALKSYSDSVDMDIVCVTTYDTEGKSTEAYADDFFDYNGYGRGKNRDGVLLLIDMGNRSYWISTRGFGMTAINQDAISGIERIIKGFLSDGEYYQALNAYASAAADYAASAREGNPYQPKFLENFRWGTAIVISIITGVVLAIIITLSMKGKHKSVKFKSNAADYMVPGTLDITRSNDYYLYSHTTRIKINNDSNSGGSHVSSSGATHGGGGGRF